MAEKLPTMEEHADALHPVTPRPDSGAPWGRDASGRPKPFQSSVTQGSTIGTKAPPTIPSKPAVGRIVHFKHTGKSGLETEPAIITRVHSDMCVSLYVMPFDGVARAVTS